MSQENVERVKQAVEAMNDRNIEAALKFAHPDIEWQEGPGAPEGGIHHGRDSFEGFLRKWLESFDAFRIEPEEILEHQNLLIALVRQTGTGRASGVEVEVSIAHVWTVKDGQAVRWQSASRQDGLALVG